MWTWIWSRIDPSEQVTAALGSCVRILFLWKSMKLTNTLINTIWCRNFREKQPSNFRGCYEADDSVVDQFFSFKSMTPSKKGLRLMMGSCRKGLGVTEVISTSSSSCKTMEKHLQSIYTFRHNRKDMIVSSLRWNCSVKTKFSRVSASIYFLWNTKQSLIVMLDDSSMATDGYAIDLYSDRPCRSFVMTSSN